MVRVTDALNPSTKDISDNVFSIDKAVTLISPNGGENWQGGTTQTITWAVGNPISGTYRLEYSINNGGSWSQIVTNVTGTSYNWTLPNTASLQALVRISDATMSCANDVSDAAFTWRPVTPVLLTPNGGESYSQGCSYPNGITWDQTKMYSTVDIDYSLNNGATWASYAVGTTNDGAQGFNLFESNIDYPSSLFRIKNNGDPTNTYDQSNGVFTLTTPMTITSPNGGEVFETCKSFTITWTNPACATTKNLHYSLNNGSTWNTIALGVSSSLTSYAFTIPSNVNSTQCLIRIQNASSTSQSDVSNAVFSIIPNTGSIVVTSPNGGEDWSSGNTQNITWTANATSGIYNLQYSVNNGSTWSTIVSNYTGTSYAWTLPNNASTTARIRVIDNMYQSCTSDQSDAAFTWRPVTPVLLTPNGGESFYSGTTTNITWDQTKMYSTVDIDYSLNNGATWVSYVVGTTNDGIQGWTIPNASSANCLVRVRNNGDPTLTSDQSNAVFTIKPAVTIITPNRDNGVTIWGGCTVTSITFDRSPAWSSYTIQYSLNAGASWNNITTNFTATTNPATYNWNIGNIFSTKAQVKVIPNLATSNFDTSDSTFTITKPVTIIKPNLGGILQVGTTYDIKWQSDGISSAYDIFYSANGGSTWNNVVTNYNTSDNTYPWTVPNTPTTNALIRVRDNLNTCKEDTSNLFFTISTTPPGITLTSPNGQETLSGCNNHLITWSEPSGNIGTYNLAYSMNAGASWINIVNNFVTSSKSYNWVIPDINSSNVLVRVQSSAAPSTFDISDALLTIKKGKLDIINNDTTICTGSSVQLVATGAPNYFWTPSTDLNSNTIHNPIATPGSTTKYFAQYSIGGCALKDSVTITVLSGTTTASVSIAASPSNAICAGTSVTFTATPVNGGANPAYQWKLNGTNVGTNSPSYSNSSLTNGNTVSVEMTSNSSCVAGGAVSSNIITMEVNTTAGTPETITGNTTICEGSSQTYSVSPVSNASSYTWLLPSGWSGTSTTNTISVTAGSAGGNISVKANNGCGSSAESLRFITVNNLPSVTFSPMMNVCNTAGPFALFGGDPEGGAYSGPGVSGGQFNPSSAGIGTHSLLYTYTDNNLCSRSATSQITVDVCTGNLGQADINSVTVQPNPFSNHAVMFIPKTVKPENAYLYIFNMEGILVKTIQDINTNEVIISSENLASGMYFFQLVNHNKLVSRGKLLLEE
ncbi:MAG: T9SS type A sorting domain-containing protein [Cytophagaceae bacterium]